MKLRNELSLPTAVITDELRFLQFEESSSIQTFVMHQASDLPEIAANNYRACASAQPRGECAPILRGILQHRPAEGRVWLEYSKALAVEGDDDISAIEALERSYEMAPHEGWLVYPRISFALSIWKGMPSGLKARAQSEILGKIDDPNILNSLVQKYVSNPFSRDSIKDVLGQATPEQTQRFIWRVESLAKGTTH